MVYSPEPGAEVYCARLNFNISKLVTSNSSQPREHFSSYPDHLQQGAEWELVTRFVKTFRGQTNFPLRKESYSFHGHFEEEANDETKNLKTLSHRPVELVARTNKDSSLEFLRDFTKLFVRHIYGLDPMPAQVVK